MAAHQWPVPTCDVGNDLSVNKGPGVIQAVPKTNSSIHKDKKEVICFLLIVLMKLMLT